MDNEPVSFVQRMKKALVMGGVLLLVVALGSAYYFYKQTKEVNLDPNAATDKEVKSLVEEVSKLIVLPEGEVPTVATVEDPSKLVGQPFFVNAKQGDKLLIYTTARKAVLYRPNENRIIEVAPLVIGDQGTTNR